MRLHIGFLIAVAAALVGCSTPYRPALIVHGSAPFTGIAGLIEPDRPAQLDVLLVHGMCTHTRDDAVRAIEALATALNRDIAPAPARLLSIPDELGGIEIETREVAVGGSTVRFAALVWSPLTQPLKAQLAYDATGTPTDCAAPGECRPLRARINGALKDGLLNDCLADALIYQGRSRPAIRQRMADAIARVLDDSRARAQALDLRPGALALVSDSLGSKISFDALDWMTAASAPDARKAAGEAALDRLAIVYMQANQLPILGLADQSIAPAPRAIAAEGDEDSLLRLLSRKKAPAATLRPAQEPRLALVAFTDPNDLLSYRLLRSRYDVAGIAVSDVLVSNDSTWLGLLERPDSAHTHYPQNRDVTRLIACGSVGSALCAR
jgi:hypothetical protein